MQFNFIAPYYDALSRIVFGNVLEKAKISHFDSILSGSRVLIIGGGTGSSLLKLLTTKDLIVDYVDPSQKMISIAQNRIRNSSNVMFYTMPIEQFDCNGYDVIITEFFFDLFTLSKIEALVSTISLKLNKNGVWINTDFNETPNVKNKFMLKLMHIFFKITAKIPANKLVSTRELFRSAEFELVNESMFRSGFISSISYQKNFK